MADTKVLTPQQRSALNLLRTASPRPLNGLQLAEGLGSGQEGAHMTAASLVRRGMAQKVKVAGRIAYVVVGGAA